MKSFWRLHSGFGGGAERKASTVGGSCDANVSALLRAINRKPETVRPLLRSVRPDVWNHVLSSECFGIIDDDHKVEIIRTILENGGRDSPLAVLASHIIQFTPYDDPKRRIDRIHHSVYSHLQVMIQLMIAHDTCPDWMTDVLDKEVEDSLAHVEKWDDLLEIEIGWPARDCIYNVLMGLVRGSGRVVEAVSRTAERVWRELAGRDGVGSEVAHMFLDGECSRGMSVDHVKVMSLKRLFACWISRNYHPNGTAVQPHVDKQAGATILMKMSAEGSDNIAKVYNSLRKALDQRGKEDLGVQMYISGTLRGDLLDEFKDSVLFSPIPKNWEWKLGTYMLYDGVEKDFIKDAVGILFAKDDPGHHWLEDWAKEALNMSGRGELTPEWLDREMRHYIVAYGDTPIWASLWTRLTLRGFGNEIFRQLLLDNLDEIRWSAHIPKDDKEFEA
jgi:hypothetical protein